ncbi:MAG: Uncharacterised protein [Flavobacteriia bacterium]|nr:MAG: Uncharacterised protein [Flavobacteriia bacterium]
MLKGNGPPIAENRIGQLDLRGHAADHIPLTIGHIDLKVSPDRTQEYSLIVFFHADREQILPLHSGLTGQKTRLRIDGYWRR